MASTAPVCALITTAAPSLAVGYLPVVASTVCRSFVMVCCRTFCTYSWSPRSMLVTTVSPWTGFVLLRVPTTWPWALTESASWPAVPRKYCSYSFSSPFCPYWLAWE